MLPLALLSSPLMAIVALVPAWIRPVLVKALCR